jgi:hypothetical protein
MAALRDVSERLGQLHRERRDLEDELGRHREYRADLERRGIGAMLRRQPRLAADDPGFVIEHPDTLNVDRIPLLERLASLQTKIKRLTTRQTEAQARSDRLGRLASTCLEWARGQESHPLTAVLSDAASVLRSMRAPSTDLIPRELETVRTALKSVAAERKTVESAAVTLPLATARANAYVDRIIGEWVPEPGAFFSANYDDLPDFYGNGLVPAALDAQGMRALVCRLLADPIKSMLRAELERRENTYTLRLDPADRTRQLAALDAKAYAFGVREEWLIMLAEAAGPTTIVRREMADPRSVLGVTLA